MPRFIVLFKYPGPCRKFEIQPVENTPVEILVVDDDPVACARLKAYFTAEGYAVFVANDGGGMWRVLDSEAISVVLLDVGLPGKDGLELARELRAHDEGLLGGLEVQQARVEPGHPFHGCPPALRTRRRAGVVVGVHCEPLRGGCGGVRPTGRGA